MIMPITMPTPKTVGTGERLLLVIKQACRALAKSLSKAIDCRCQSLGAPAMTHAVAGGANWTRGIARSGSSEGVAKGAKGCNYHMGITLSFFA